MATALQPEEITAALETLPAWTHADPFIERTIAFPSYRDGVDFLVAVADLAETRNHHPELGLSWRKLHIQLTTHSRGGLTDLDLEMARAIDALEAQRATS